MGGEILHVCQMTVGKVVIFYTVADYLVFFTVFCTWAEKMGIEVLALCPMLDHIHHTSIAPNHTSFVNFQKGYSRVFAFLWNSQRKRKGPLFFHNYSSSTKVGNKSIRTTLAYNYNNCVERKLADRAETYRWNFLPYASNQWPFSEPIGKSISAALQKAMKEVQYLHEQGKFLNYAIINRVTKKLTIAERQQFIDYVIGLWNVIDYNKAISYYGDLKTMIRAFHDNTGGEYDIREDWDPYSDTVYTDCTHILLKEQLVDSIYDIPMLPMDKKKQFFKILKQRTAARPKQLRKYLHIPAQENTD